MKNRPVLVEVARSRAVGGLVLLGVWPALDRSRAVLVSNLALGAVAGCRLEAQRRLHRICANTICYIYLYLKSSKAIVGHVPHSLSTLQALEYYCSKGCHLYLRIQLCAVYTLHIQQRE